MFTKPLYWSLFTYGFSAMSPVINLQSRRNNNSEKLLFQNVNINKSRSVNGTSSIYNRTQETVWSIRWKNYARDWATFYIKHFWLTFDTESKIGVYNDKYRDDDLHIQEIQSLFNVPVVQLENTARIYNHVKLRYDGGFFGAKVYLEAFLEIWQRVDHIFIKYVTKSESKMSSAGSRIDLKINSLWFEKPNG